MAIEPKRGCGYRKAGGLYLVSFGIPETCERLPIPIEKCPVCRHTPVARTRGTQFIGAQFIFGMALPCHEGDARQKTGHHGHCPICNEDLLAASGEPDDQFLLLWIGKEHYATPEDWCSEANRLGVSRRIPAIPKGFVAGKTWVLVAHPEAITKTQKMREDGDLMETEKIIKTPGIFHAFRPEGVELVVTPSMKDQEWVKDLVEKKGVKLVDVPEDDPDHAPPVRRKSARHQAMEEHGRKFSEEDET